MGGRVVQELANAARADEAKDDGGSDVNLERVDKIREEHRVNRGMQTVPISLETIGAVGDADLERIHVLRFDVLVHEFENDAERENRHRENAGGRRIAEEDGPDDCENEGRYRANDVDDDAQDDIHRTGSADVMGGQEIERDRKQSAKDGRDPNHLNRFPNLSASGKPKVIPPPFRGFQRPRGWGE